MSDMKDIFLVRVGDTSYLVLVFEDDSEIRIKITVENVFDLASRGIKVRRNNEWCNHSSR